MYCKNCGSQINDNANVCGYCGTPVHTQNGFSNNQQQNNTVSGQQVYGEPTPSYSGSTQNSNYDGLQGKAGSRCPSEADREVDEKISGLLWKREP